jgi:hypothetical protein
MAMKVYTLKKKPETEEYHLFEGEMTSLDRCSVDNLSICEKMERTENRESIFACQNENSARTKCASIGRNVCGTCVSHLYETFD